MNLGLTETRVELLEHQPKDALPWVVGGCALALSAVAIAQSIASGF